MKNVGKECNLQMLRNICPEPNGVFLEVGNMTTSTTLWGRSFVYLQFAGDFRIFFIIASISGRWTHFDEHIFQMGWFNHQPDNICVFSQGGVLSS